MPVRISLKTRVYLIHTVLFLTTLAGGILLVWYTYQTEKLFHDVVKRNIAIFQSAESLSTALTNQKGFVSYFFLDGDPDWLDQLNEYRKRFRNSLQRTEALVEDDTEKKVLDEINHEYMIYITAKDKVIQCYKSGNREEGAVLHKNIRPHFFKLLDLCEEFKNYQKEKIECAMDKSRKASKHLRLLAFAAIIIIFSLILLINFIFIRHILTPIQRLAMETDFQGSAAKQVNEVTALKQSIHGLIENAAQTHIELKKSREHLMHSEKMAVVGQLAAGTAHSIRNPLTSVKMRLFSLSRSQEFNESAQEDFSVITDEINHINKIVQNFLEFSRPPKLEIREVSPSAVVDSALQLLEYRLKSYEVSILLNRERPLPKTEIDPEQLKEVIVNIIINACEAMERGGKITISEEENYVEPLKKVAVIRINDNGPGIPPEITDQIFNPFFTTKDKGTGLGLSIAFNIIEEHGGWLDINSIPGEGASFIITLPV